MHLYAWLLPNVHLKGKNFIDIYLINKEIIKNILSRLLETGLFEKKKKELTMVSLAYAPFPIFRATSCEIFLFTCSVNFQKY